MLRALSGFGMIVFIVIAALAILFMVDASYAQEFDTATNTPVVEVTEAAPVPDVPVVVVQPQSPVNYETILLFIGAVIAALVWYANQTNKRVQSSVPFELAMTIADALVKLTPSPLDDALLARIRGELVETSEPLPKPPPPPEKTAVMRISPDESIG